MAGLDKSGIQWDSSGEAWYNSSTGDWVHTGIANNNGTQGYGNTASAAGTATGTTTTSGPGTNTLPAGLVSGRMDIWDPMQWKYLQDLSSGALYGEDATKNYFNNTYDQLIQNPALSEQDALDYFNQAYDPTLKQQAAEAQGTLKQTYGPMSLGSSYKVGASKLAEQLAEERAKQLATVMYQYKQMAIADAEQARQLKANALSQWQQTGANALAQIPNMSPYANIVTRAPGSIGTGNMSTISPTGGGGGGSGLTTTPTKSNTYQGAINQGNPFKSLLESQRATANPFADILQENNYYDVLSGNESIYPTSTGTSSEFQNPFTGEDYNYVPGVNTSPAIANTANARVNYEDTTPAYTPTTSYESSWTPSSLWDTESYW
jgi:hypothetical protein